MYCCTLHVLLSVSVAISMVISEWQKWRRKTAQREKMANDNDSGWPIRPTERDGRSLIGELRLSIVKRFVSSRGGATITVLFTQWWWHYNSRIYHGPLHDISGKSKRERKTRMARNPNQACYTEGFLSFAVMTHTIKTQSDRQTPLFRR